MNNTQDLSNFGYVEIDEAIKLLKEYKNHKSILGAMVQIEFNPNSGNVFLIDNNYDTAMMNGDVLDRWYSCPVCGHEGFINNMDHRKDDEECQAYVAEIKGAAIKS